MASIVQPSHAWHGSRGPSKVGRESSRRRVKGAGLPHRALAHPYLYGPIVAVRLRANLEAHSWTNERPVMADIVAKVFCPADQKFCGLWMRLSCKDVGDLIAGRQTHGRPR